MLNIACFAILRSDHDVKALWLAAMRWDFSASANNGMRFYLDQEVEHSCTQVGVQVHVTMRRGDWRCHGI